MRRHDFGAASRLILRRTDDRETKSPTNHALRAPGRNPIAFSIYAASSIKDIVQLRGKKMAVTRFGGTMEFAARHFLETHGFEPGKDIVLIQIGSSADVVPAMTNGLVQSEVMSVRYLFIARRLGVRELADLSQTGVRYAQAALVAKRSFLRDKREIVGQFIRSTIEAVHYLKTKPAMACGSWVDLCTDDADILKQGLITMFISCFFRCRIFVRTISNCCCKKRR